MAAAFIIPGQIPTIVTWCGPGEADQLSPGSERINPLNGGFSQPIGDREGHHSQSRNVSTKEIVFSLLTRMVREGYSTL
jgi:hypothetical protein